MSGPNQHHIPQFLQRACGVKPKGKRPKEIWFYTREADPELRLIAKTASEDYFYSMPSADGTKTLDELLTEAETALAPECRKLRALPRNSKVDSILAAGIVMQLAPRTSHIRLSMASAFWELTNKVNLLFSDKDNVRKILGFEADQPEDRFLENLRGEIDKHPAEIEMLGLPQPVVERVAYFIMKERFDDTIFENVAAMLNSLGQVSEHVPTMARDAHNDFVGKMHERNVRRERLEGLVWAVEQAPPEGAILPDCVALAYDDKAQALPMMFAGNDIALVAMPLSSDLLLVGRGASAESADLAQFNCDAAACSQDFFLANRNDDQLTSLSLQIGERSKALFQGAMQDAAETFLRERGRNEEQVSDDVVDEIASTDDHSVFTYDISCRGYSSDEIGLLVVDEVKSIVSAVGGAIPLVRLDGITFAGDYPTALREVDRGRNDLPPAETVGADVGVGIAQMIVVVRAEQPKGRVVLNAAIGEGLISEDNESRAWALNVLVHQLVLVALIEWVEHSLPGTILQPIADEFNGPLYQAIDGALQGYVASFISAKLGNSQVSDIYRELLCSALARLKADVEKERLDYRHHGNLERLLAVAMPATGHVLRFAAELIGSCESNEQAVFDSDGELENVLDESGLLYWFADFAKDLPRFRQRIGQWQSIDEFFVFNRHVERVLWSVGLFPWHGPEGPRVEVPLISDAAALMNQEDANA